MTTLQEISKNDSNNSGVYNKFTLSQKFSNTGIFTGYASNTTGYNSIIVTINTNVNSIPCGLLIQFSDTGNDFDSNGAINYSTVFYSDTVFTNSINKTHIPPYNKFFGSGSFTKNYPILKQYFRIKYTPRILVETLIINTQFSTQNYNSNINSLTTFTNKDENIYDALGKLRVSYPVSVIDIKIPLCNNGTTGFCSNYLDICQGTSGITGATNIVYKDASFIFGVSGPSQIISQSRKYCITQTGKSFILMAKGIIGYIPNYFEGPCNFYNNIGYFDDKNGFFFNYMNGIANIYIRQMNSDIITVQQKWNIDRLDGTGPSGIVIDFTLPLIFVIDFGGSDTNRIRFGFYIFGKIIYCHQIIENSDIYNFPKINLYEINLPIRYEINGVTGCTGIGHLTQMNSTIISEGEYNPNRKIFSMQWSNNYSISSETPIFALRGGEQNYYHQNIIPTQISLGSTNTNDVFIYRLRLYINPNDAPINSSTNWYSPDNYSSFGTMSVAQGTTGPFVNFNTINSTVVNSGIISKGGTFDINNNDDYSNYFQITSDIENVSSILVLTIEGSASYIYGSFTWQEVY